MTDEIYELQTILDIAENLGYYDGHYSDQPTQLIAFIDGYLSRED
jgi:hypothetical protein